eukprot:TRINITY_DN5523_c0_g1_i10.p1 TRINITY_DN5523_c0_g1~~TRINITY_DN5523_c0_g1_i10.p1  ORF type:complete len:188 (+),score=-27.75 TRINITY_DN5523_c0_g1_i10:848-1411(+)
MQQNYYQQSKICCYKQYILGRLIFLSSQIYHCITQIKILATFNSYLLIKKLKLNLKMFLGINNLSCQYQHNYQIKQIHYQFFTFNTKTYNLLLSPNQHIIFFYFQNFLQKLLTNLKNQKKQNYIHYNIILIVQNQKTKQTSKKDMIPILSFTHYLHFIEVIYLFIYNNTTQIIFKQKQVIIIQKILQ